MTPRTGKRFMCYSCQDATAVISNPGKWGVHRCEWCGQVRDGTYVGNKLPKKSQAQTESCYAAEDAPLEIPQGRETDYDSRCTCFTSVRGGGMCFNCRMDKAFEITKEE